MAICLPQTYAIDLARRFLLPGDTPAPLVTIGALSPVQTDVVLLAVAAIVLPYLGIRCFRAGLHKAQLDGGLSRWS